MYGQQFITFLKSKKENSVKNKADAEIIMENEISQFEKLLGNLSVDALVMGHNKVDRRWSDYDFIPDYNKFYFILSGEGYLKIGDKEYYPQSNQLWLMPEGIQQSYSVTNPENPFTKYWVHFRAKVGNTNLFNILHAPVCLNIQHHKYLQGLFDHMLSYYFDYNCTFTRQIMINSYMTQIICYYLELSDVKNIFFNTSNDNSRIVELLEYIDTHLDKELTLEILSDVAHLQPNYFINFFKKYMNSSPMQYVMGKRIERATMLLQNTNQKINFIAKECGFKDELYFSKAFKKNFGITPSEYRKSYKNSI